MRIQRIPQRLDEIGLAALFLCLCILLTGAERYFADPADTRTQVAGSCADCRSAENPASAVRH